MNYGSIGVVAGLSCLASADGFVAPALHSGRSISRETQSPGENDISAFRPILFRGGSDLQALAPVLRPNSVFSTELLAKSQETSIDATTAARMATSYYLLWSPGFMEKFGISVAGLFGLHVTGVSTSIAKLIATGLKRSVTGSTRNILLMGVPNFVLPLLSSSCCLLQLLINATVGASGCAGFNTILGPVRPEFLALLTYLNWRTGPTLAQGFIRTSLALLPEMVHGWNTYLARSWQRKQQETELSQLNNPSESSRVKAAVEVEIPAMGCVACINKIESSLRQSSPTHVLDVNAWLNSGQTKGGRVRIVLSASSEDEVDSLNQMIVNTISGAGFLGSKIVDLQVETVGAVE